ncbi:MAG: hypothetical protein RLZZ347_98 [Candidatus Parcubacteria bacterium]|jgi:8-oxo-dGTP diphosphatase
MISKTPLTGFKKKFDVVSAFVEHEEKILLLHRQDHKPQGDMWCAPGGKVDVGESLLGAVAREIAEEVGVFLAPEQYHFFESYYVRFPEFDFMYHVYRVVLGSEPKLALNLSEHKDFQWVRPIDALKLNLIQDEDACIKWAYGIK